MDPSFDHLDNTTVSAKHPKGRPGISLGHYLVGIEGQEAGTLFEVVAEPLTIGRVARQTLISANIIRHGLPTSDVKVEVDFRDDEIVLTFDDDGVPFDPREQPAPRVPESIEEAEVGGLGLVLVRSISTRLDYERTADERNHLTLAIPAR